MRPRTDAQRERPRAYTLVEVLVAMSMGVLVSMAAFMLSKNATQFFQHEARISSAQLALTLAMNRLTSDIQRASFLSSPSALNDPRVCRDTMATWPAGLKSLAGINVTVSPQATPQSLANGFVPDALIIGGSMDTTEVFQVQSIIPGNSGAPLVILRAPNLEPATARINASLGPGETLLSRLTPLFYPTGVAPSGRFAHIYHPEGDWHWFGTIDSFTIDPNGAVNIQLGALPTIPAKPGSNCGLGIGDIGGGWLFSVVSRSRYDIRNLGSLPNSNPYSAITSPVAAAVTGDAGRTELVRVELDPSGNEIPSTLEVIAEYAVDMRFGLTVSTMVTASNYNPTVTAYPFNDSHVYTVSKDPNLGGTPQLIRGVQVRLSTRARAPDRDADLPVGLDGRKLHFLVDPSLAQKYARMRTSYVSVALPNQGGFSLW